MRVFSCVSSATVALSLLFVQGTRSSPEQVIRENVAVPMRDSVVLRADVMLPSAEGRFPTLVYRTPYGKKSAPSEWTTFRKAVARGYAVVVQDVRGRYDSEGEFNPYQNEGRDGYDTIEWAAKQPWSNHTFRAICRQANRKPRLQRRV